MFALLMEDVCQFKKLIYLFGNMEKAAQTQKILLSGSSKAQFNAQFFCRKSQFFRFKVEGEWHHMQVSKKESLNLRNSIVRNCSAKQKKSSKLQSRKFQSFLKALSLFSLILKEIIMTDTKAENSLQMRNSTPQCT